MRRRALCVKATVVFVCERVFAGCGDDEDEEEDGGDDEGGASSHPIVDPSGCSSLHGLAGLLRCECAICSISSMRTL